MRQYQVVMQNENGYRMQNRMDTGYKRQDEKDTGYMIQGEKNTGLYHESCIVHRASCVGSYHALRITHYASRSERGLTLIEMMIALVVLLLVSLAMMQTALVSIDANMTNVLRDEAVGIAEMRMSDARNLPYTSTTDTLASDTSGLVTTGCSVSSPCPADFLTKFSAGSVVNENLRNITSFCFCTNRAVTPLSTETKEIDIRVDWIWKGNPYTHTISTIVRRQ